MIKTFYRGFKILLSPGHICITNGSEEFTASLQMEPPELMRWAKHKIDRILSEAG